MLHRLKDGGANVYCLVLCIKIPCVSANLSLLQIVTLPLLFESLSSSNCASYWINKYEIVMHGMVPSCL